MTASTALQTPLEVAVHHRAMAVAGWHFGGLVTIRECADLDEQSRLDAGVGLALVPETCEEGLADWLLVDSRHHVIASNTLSVERVAVDLMIGRHPADPVDRELTLIARRAADRVVIDRKTGRLEAPIAGISADHRIIGVIAASVDQDQS